MFPPPGGSGAAWSLGFEVDMLACQREHEVAVTARAKLDLTGPESLLDRRIGQVMAPWALESVLFRHPLNVGQ